MSKVTDDKTYPEKTEKTEAMVNKYAQILEEVFRDYNIVDDQLVNIAKNFLDDKEFTDYLFELAKEKGGLSENKGLVGLF